MSNMTRRAPALKSLSISNAQTSRSEEHTSELQSQSNLVCRLLLEKKKNSIAPLALHIAKKALVSPHALEPAVKSVLLSRSEEHPSKLQSTCNLSCHLPLETQMIL